MKKIFLLATCFCFVGLLNAQITSNRTPVIKQTKIEKTDSNIVNIQRVPATSTISF